MSKMSELSMSLDELTACGESLAAVGERLIKAASNLRDIFTDTAARTDAPESKDVVKIRSEKQPGQKTEAAKTEPVKTYTFADVRKAFSAKSHAGYTGQVKALIGKYGAEKLSSIKEEDYPAIMADLEAL